jgi:hypothetical protein
MFKNRFFENNFLTFLSQHKRFFKQNEVKFILNFLEILKKKNPKLYITTEYKNFIKELYESFFLKGSFEEFTLNNSIVIEELKEANIDFEDIFNKLFLLLSNSFIKYIIKEKNSLHHLKKLTTLFEFYLEYLLYHLKEPVFNIRSIPKEIKEYYLNNKELSLLSVYKGIPITSTTTIRSVNEEKGTIEVKANYYQIIASKFQKEIFLLEPKTNKTFKANISRIYPEKRILELYNIEKINRKTSKRNYVRVQPHEDIVVTVTKNSQSFETKMYDISLRGTALISLSKLPLEVGDIVNISFVLDFDNIYYFNLQSEIKSISKLNNATYRYHLYFEPNSKDEKVLERYITKREKEIIKELQIFLKKELKNV